MFSQNVNYYFAQNTPWFPTQSKCQSPLYGMFNDRIPEKKTSELRPEGGRKREPHEHFEEEHSWNKVKQVPIRPFLTSIPAMLSINHSVLAILSIL